VLAHDERSSKMDRFVAQVAQTKEKRDVHMRRMQHKNARDGVTDFRDCAIIFRKNAGALCSANESGYVPAVRCYHFTAEDRNLGCDCIRNDTPGVSLTFSLSDTNQALFDKGYLFIDDSQWLAQQENAKILFLGHKADALAQGIVPGVQPKSMGVQVFGFLHSSGQ